MNVSKGWRVRKSPHSLPQLATGAQAIMRDPGRWRCELRVGTVGEVGAVGEVGEAR